MKSRSLYEEHKSKLLIFDKNLPEIEKLVKFNSIVKYRLSEDEK